MTRPRLQGGFAAKEPGWSKFLVGKSILISFQNFWLDCFQNYWLEKFFYIYLQYELG